jgi:hypothetical protein
MLSTSYQMKTEGKSVFSIKALYKWTTAECFKTDVFSSCISSYQPCTDRDIICGRGVPYFRAKPAADSDAVGLWKVVEGRLIPSLSATVWTYLETILRWAYVECSDGRSKLLVAMETKTLPLQLKVVAIFGTSFGRTKAAVILKHMKTRNCKYRVKW